MSEAPEAPPDWVAQRSRSHPHHPAIEFDGRRLTYAELDSRVAGAASALVDIGNERGEPVAVLMGNGVDFAVFAHAVPRSGAAFMPLNARLTVDELAWQLGDAGVRTMVVDGEHSPAGREAAAASGATVVDAADARWSSSGEASGAGAFEPSRVHSVIFTSGTSGRPNGVLLTYGNFQASADASAANLGVEPDDRWLACMPLFHVGGLSILLRSAIYGTAAVVHERFEAAAVNRALREDGITLLSVVPTMLERMLEADGEPFPPSVRAALVGGAPVARALLETALGRGLPVLQTYGLTEAASQVSTLSAGDALRRLGSAGLPLRDTALRIEAEGRPASTGEAGEIIVSGPAVSPGYLGDPAATAGALRDGWLHTGDLGYVDEDGYLYVTDRRDDLIVTGGENVSPAEVESALLAHSAVAECAVVGLPDREWGAVVAAVIVPAGGCAVDGAALEAHLRERLAGYKLPRRFVLSAEPLPRTATGKLLRRVVRERLAER